ncbi:putative ATPase [Tilletia horrida]|uniref:ATPase n=1 Tax=Tilletia horrida TaxID=155126 RepID=A0AAN6GXU4_9BASI|nr:putative ATPase [Tilletia horrida]KAK0569571.1 putative ATPase [Tilletia horrida]
MSDDEAIIAAAREADGMLPDETSNRKAQGSGDAKVKVENGQEEEEAGEEEQSPEEKRKHDQRIAKLKFLLEKSSIYSRIMGERMEAERVRRAEMNSKKKQAAQNGAAEEAPATTGGRRATRANPKADTETSEDLPTHSRKKRRTDGNVKGGYEISSYLEEDDLKAAATSADVNGKEKGKKRAREAKDGEDDEQQKTERSQPRLLTGAKMRDYQIDGLEWLISLYENGLNGILADEMGLGKTIQTISFFAHLRENRVWGPFLVCAPLSTITNWVLEFERFTPGIPVILYYGSGPERAELRTKHRLNHIPKTEKEKNAFPVVVSSYEIIMRDRKHLAYLDWKYIVVDEGHRLKNMDCKLVRELKTYRSANRLILTGTPLHNNLAELWSLLNFILPDIFDDLATFEKWFDFSDLHDDKKGGEGSGGDKLLSKEQSGSIITQLHAILKPFLLRRLKADVETDLPPKKEYLLYAPLTAEQKEFYDALLSRDIRRWLMEKKTGLKWEEIVDILEGDWEEKRMAGFNYSKHGRSSKEIAAGNGDETAQAEKISELSDDEPEPARNGKAHDRNEANTSTRSSVTAVESPISEASTRMGTPARSADKAAQPHSPGRNTPRRSTRANDHSQTPDVTPSRRSTKDTPVKKTQSKDDRKGKSTKREAKTPESGRSKTSGRDGSKRRASTRNDADNPIVIDDDEEDEDFVGSDDDRKSGRRAAERSERYPKRRARKEVDYSTLDADFNEKMWRQIDAGEGGEDMDSAKMNEANMSAWYGSSRTGVAVTSKKEEKDEGPSKEMIRKLGRRKASELKAELQGKQWLIREAQKEIYNMRLENIVMQLRKVCCHPFLFDWPIDRDAGCKVVNEDLINASGKMLMLNRLLDALFAKGHKVLIFSQFTTMLDIIEDWATEYKGLRICRIDGNTSQELRRQQMKSFNGEKGPDACNLFLLSTRAGGLGINLVAADTVIFYDSDWNPQMDLQAQDRVHRIGQTRPVLIFRLVSANTVEQKVLQRAGNKRKLEALVIQQGKFKLPAGISKNTLTGRGSSQQESLTDMAAALLRLDGERVQLVRRGDEIISDANLERLLDRSPAAYQRQRGWVGAVDGGEHEAAKGKKAGRGNAQAAFEVTSTEVEGDVNDAVARLMAGEA